MDPIWWIHDYPEDIQEEYFKTHERIPTKMHSPTVAIKKGFALLLALGIMTVLMIVAGANGFLSAFALGLIMISIGCQLDIGETNWYLPAGLFLTAAANFANLYRVRRNKEKNHR